MKTAYKIGPAVIAIEIKSIPQVSDRSLWKGFKYSGNEAPSLTLRLGAERIARETEAIPACELPGHWRLYEEKEAFYFEVLEPVEFQPKFRARIEKTLSEADVQIIPSASPAQKGTPGWHIEDLGSTVIQWWLAAWGALRKKGILFHGGAVAWDHRAAAFVGPSGAGKTTLAKICRDLGGASVLSDERILVWREGEEWRVSGTPWAGMLGEALPVSRALDRVFVLKKGTENQQSLLAPKAVFPRLMTEAFFPLWSQEAMGNLLEQAQRLISDTSVAELQFVNQASAASYLKSVLTPDLISVEKI